MLWDCDLKIFPHPFTPGSSPRVYMFVNLILFNSKLVKWHNFALENFIEGFL